MIGRLLPILIFIVLGVLLAVGLMIAFVAIAFVGFVLLLVGLWWISNGLHLDDWFGRARSLVSPTTRDGRDGSSGHP